MLSATLQQGLSDYEIGYKLRTLRLKKKMGLVELGKHTGLSPALLSKIERGRMFPTLPTLLRIALVFSVGLDYFFAGVREKPLFAVSRKSDRVMLPDRPGGREVSYRFGSLDYGATERRFNAFYAEFPAVAAEKATRHEHSGVELLFVLEGALELRFDEETTVLEAGDSAYFDATRPHAYRRSGTRRCAGVVITAG